MSGGSYDYLCYAESDQISSRINDMESMRDALAGYDANDFAMLTQDFILELRRQEIIRESYLRKLQGVWRAVEWKESCDIGEEDMQKVFNNSRKGV